MSSTLTVGGNIVLAMRLVEKFQIAVVQNSPFPIQYVQYRQRLPPLAEPQQPAGLKSKSHTWALDVTDDASRGIVHELDADLGDTTTGTCRQETHVSARSDLKISLADAAKVSGRIEFAIDLPRSLIESRICEAVQRESTYRCGRGHGSPLRA